MSEPHLPLDIVYLTRCRHSAYTWWLDGQVAEWIDGLYRVPIPQISREANRLHGQTCLGLALFCLPLESHNRCYCGECCDGLQWENRAKNKTETIESELNFLSAVSLTYLNVSLFHWTSIKHPAEWTVRATSLVASNLGSLKLSRLPGGGCSSCIEPPWQLPCWHHGHTCRYFHV